MKSIVIYKSNTGFTKKYAEWIAEALSCDLVPIEQLKSVNPESYDALIFGGWFFAGSIQGLKECKESLLSFKGKKAVFATGATPSGASESAQAMNNCLTEDERKDIGTFYMDGGLKYDQMSFVHKSMMKMMCAMMKKQHGADSEEYKRVSQSFDATEKSKIEPLISYINGTAF